MRQIIDPEWESRSTWEDLELYAENSARKQFVSLEGRLVVQVSILTSRQQQSMYLPPTTGASPLHHKDRPLRILVPKDHSRDLSVCIHQASLRFIEWERPIVAMFRCQWVRKMLWVDWPWLTGCLFFYGTPSQLSERLGKLRETCGWSFCPQYRKPAILNVG